MRVTQDERTHDLDAVNRQGTDRRVVGLCGKRRQRGVRCSCAARRKRPDRLRTDDMELVLIDRDLERRCGIVQGSFSCWTRCFICNRLTVRAFVDEAKADALVRREAQFGQVGLRELVAGSARCRETAVVQATTVDDVGFRRRRDGGLGMIQAARVRFPERRQREEIGSPR